MIFRKRPDPAFLKQRLILQRQMTSLIDRAFLSEGAHFLFDKTNWVRCWIDLGYEVRGDDGLKAYRAITEAGQLFWMVYHPNKKHAYHATADDPVAAIEEAIAAWYARKQVRQNWRAVKDLRRDLLTFRRANFTVHRIDAYQAGLCRIGVDGFMRRLGFGALQSLPARRLALLSLIDEQAAFAIYGAHLRVCKRTHRLTASAEVTV